MAVFKGVVLCLAKAGCAAFSPQPHQYDYLQEGYADWILDATARDPGTHQSCVGIQGWRSISPEAGAACSSLRASLLSKLCSSSLHSFS